MLNYFFEGGTKVPDMVGPKPGVRQTLTLSDSSRTLELIDALMFPFGWQVYASGNVSHPVAFEGSVINELGALFGGTMVARRSQFNLAVIASMGGGSHVKIEESPSIESQSILADGSGSIHISDSVIYGSLIQARGDSTILLTNNTLAKNKQNPFNPLGAPVTFKVDPTSNAKIVVAALQPPSPNGVFRGDAFIEGKGSSECIYTLSYRKEGTWISFPIVSRQPCGKRGEVLGALAGPLAPAAYQFELTLFIGKSVATVVYRPFTIR